MTLDDFMVSFSNVDREQLLSEWRWLMPSSLQPILITALGNVFVHDVSTDEIHMLDVGSADLIPVATSTAEFNLSLQKRDFVMQFFDTSLVTELRNAFTLPAGNLYGFKKLPTLGGEYELSNFEPTDIEIHFSICGQLQQRLKDAPTGSRIGSVSIA